MTVMLELVSKKHIEILNGLAKNKRLAHAYLFCGPVGAFVATAVDYFVQAVLCSQLQEKPCGTCERCRHIASGAHTDLVKVLVESATGGTKESIGIEQIRTLHERVKYGPSSGAFLFVLLYQAEKMTTQAAHAFLKLLEEPPQGVYFILGCQHEMDMLPTIRSRCQSMVFPNVSLKIIQNYVSHLAAEEQKKMQTLCQNRVALLPFLLEKPALAEKIPIPYDNFLRLSDLARLNLAESLAEDKTLAQFWLRVWLLELGYSDRGRRGVISDMEKIIENMMQFKYNINLRLHLENLFLQLSEAS